MMTRLMHNDDQSDFPLRIESGFVQLRRPSQWIVVLQDGQTTGGYPRIGFLNAATLGAFNQIPLGREFGFGVGELHR